MEKVKQRVSGVELLRIIAMVLIVISHVDKTLRTENAYILSDYIYRYGIASTNILNPILSWMESFGAQGNLIFIVCAAWFLSDSGRVNAKKIVHIVADVWIVNVALLSVFVFVCGYSIDMREIIKNLFPTIFGVSWFTTFYILLHLIHPVLNTVIGKMTQREHLTLVVGMLLIYFGFCYLDNKLFAASSLIAFIVIYFAVAYEKKYLQDFCQN